MTARRRSPVTNTSPSPPLTGAIRTSPEALHLPTTEAANRARMARGAGGAGRPADRCADRGRDFDAGEARTDDDDGEEGRCLRRGRGSGSGKRVEMPPKCDRLIVGIDGKQVLATGNARA